jgi:hypothetical protein
VAFFCGFYTETLYAFLFHSLVLHVLPCPSNPPWLHHSNYAWRRAPSYETHYAVYSKLLSLNLYSLQIFSSAPCSHTRNLCFFLKCQNRFLTHTKPQTNLSFVYSDFYIFRQQKIRQKVLDLMVTSITRVQSSLIFPEPYFESLSSFPNIWIVPRFQKLTLYNDFEVHAGDETATYTSAIFFSFIYCSLHSFNYAFDNSNRTLSACQSP